MCDLQAGSGFELLRCRCLGIFSKTACQKWYALDNSVVWTGLLTMPLIDHSFTYLILHVCTYTHIHR